VSLCILLVALAALAGPRLYGAWLRRAVG
jgi:hypothetical protein